MQVEHRGRGRSVDDGQHEVPVDDVRSRRYAPRDHTGEGGRHARAQLVHVELDVLAALRERVVRTVGRGDLEAVEPGQLVHHVEVDLRQDDAAGGVAPRGVRAEHLPGQPEEFGTVGRGRVVLGQHGQVELVAALGVHDDTVLEGPGVVQGLHVGGVAGELERGVLDALSGERGGRARHLPQHRRVDDAGDAEVGLRERGEQRVEAAGDEEAVQHGVVRAGQRLQAAELRDLDQVLDDPVDDLVLLRVVARQGEAGDATAPGDVGVLVQRAGQGPVREREAAGHGREVGVGDGRGGRRDIATECGAVLKATSNLK